MPPLNPLRVFDVAARSTSFTEAAQELSVTQAAVSRQISTLEAFLGVKLFDRDQRALTLTPDGRRLHREVGPAFDAIGFATGEILRNRDPNLVTIQSYPTVIAQKLLPNLAAFANAHRSIEINFLSAIRPDEFSVEHSDIILRLGADLPPNLSGFRFAQDVIVPAASPSLCAAVSGEFPRLMAEYPLLMTKYRHSDWNDWAEAAGISLNKARFMHFESSVLAYQAALANVGICMAQEFLLASDIAAQRLRVVSDKRLRRRSYYWCLTSPRRRVTRQLKSTLDWLQSLKEGA